MNQILNILSELIFSRIFLICFVSFAISVYVNYGVSSLMNNYKKQNQEVESKFQSVVRQCLGGMIIFICLFLINIFTTKFFKINFLKQIEWVCVFLILIALFNQILHIKQWLKLLIIATIAVTMFYKGIFISDFFGFLHINNLPVSVSVVLNIIILSCIVFAFKMLDGIDGLVVGLGFINAIVFGLMFYFKQDFEYTLFSFALAAALLGFFLFNFHPAKVFMGESGVMIIGLILMILAIKIFNYREIVVFNKTIKSLPILVALLLLPVYDMLRLFVERMINGKNPFHADNSHIYLLMMKTGLSPVKTSLVLFYVNIKLISFVVVMCYWNVYWSIIFLLIMIFGVSESLTIVAILKSSIQYFVKREKLTDMLNNNFLLMRLYSKKFNSENKPIQK